MLFSKFLCYNIEKPLFLIHLTEVCERPRCKKRNKKIKKEENITIDFSMLFAELLDRKKIGKFAKYK